MLQMARDDVKHALANLQNMTQFLTDQIPYGPDHPDENIFLYQEIEKTRRTISDESVYLDNIVRYRRLGLPQIPKSSFPEFSLASEDGEPDGVVPSIKNTALSILSSLSARKVVFRDDPEVTIEFDGSLVVRIDPFAAFHVHPVDQCWPNINVRFYKRNVQTGRLDAESYYLAHSLIEAMVSEYERLQEAETSASAP